MLNPRFVFFISILTLLGTVSIQAAEKDWQFWQEQFNRSQAEKKKSPARPPLRVKEIEITGTLGSESGVRVSSYRNQFTERCITCHDGIATVSASHPREFGCTVCHGGDGQSIDKEQAHSSLIYDPEAGTGKRNPSSLSVAAQSCGQLQCHAGHLDPDRNHIERVNKSLMATMAGMISGLRYQWAAQSTRFAKYGIRDVIDEDGDVPEKRGALGSLKALPFFSPKDLPQAPGSYQVSRHISDKLLRQKCFQCHLDSSPAPGTFRSQGCAACHFTYAPDGRYHGADPTISKTEIGHPGFHKMTALTPSVICSQCHQAFDPAAGKSETQPLEMAALIPLPLPGSGKRQEDVHIANGFDCVDCHTQFDIMGDGNLYSKQNQAVEVRCETCHGDGDTPPAFAPVTDPSDRVVRLSRHYPWSNALKDRMALTARKNKMTNVKLEKGTLWTLGKISGKKFKTPTLHKSRNAHVIPAHKKKLECTACHSQWVPRCEGCHNALDQAKMPSLEAGKASALWGTASYTLEVEPPKLMVGPRGKVAPMLPQTQRTVTVLDEKGKPVTALTRHGTPLGSYREWVFTNPHGYSGSNLVYALNPHSVGKKVRSCASCHLSPQTLGLGEGDLTLQRSSSGKNDRMAPVNRSNAIKRHSDLAPDAKTTVRGQPVAGSTQPGARPFNQKEIARILKVGNCIPCHDQYNDKIYKDIGKSYKFENKLAHRKLRKNILKRK